MTGVRSRDALQTRTLWTLRFAQVPGQAAIAGSIAVVSLLASDMLGSDRLAGLGGAAFTAGAGVTSVVIAALMRRRGRRIGLERVLIVASIGSVVAAVGGHVAAFPVFVIGMAVFGAGQAAILQMRYVAADLAEEDDKAEAISAIVWIGTLGAVFGPLLTPVEDAIGQAIGLAEFVGPYLFASVLFLVSATVINTRLRPDPLEVLDALEPDAERRRPLRQLRSSYGEIVRAPGALLGLFAMAGAQAVMVGVMTMTPPHMKDHGDAGLSAAVIAVHIVGMYALAPLVGRFVVRVGAVRAIRVGASVLVAGTLATVATGYVPVMVFAGLFLLGLGWNVCLIAGTTLLTTSVPAHARVEAQGTGDLTLSVFGATAAFGSGFVKDSFGFGTLANLGTTLAFALVIAALLATSRTEVPAGV